MSKNAKILIGSALLILITILSIIFNQIGNQTPPLSETTSYSQAAPEDTESIYIVVYLSGEIKNPGVYKVLENTRLYQVITQAGGLTENADRQAINLAQTLTDEHHIIIPKTNDPDLTDSNTNESDTNDIISINQANKSTLETLPGIGSVTAQHIIDYRTTHGPFSSLDELLNVTNIGNSTYETIRPFIRL
ncbi:MAG: helix-hairpin-helix domain-containing protein [Bacillota bacterium]